MNRTATADPSAAGLALNPAGRKELFRELFRRALRSCLRRGFAVEESFGMIWVETWEQVRLTESEESELYEELIAWARSGVSHEYRAPAALRHSSARALTL